MCKVSLIYVHSSLSYKRLKFLRFFGFDSFLRQLFENFFSQCHCAISKRQSQIKYLDLSFLCKNAIVYLKVCLSNKLNFLMLI